MALEASVLRGWAQGAQLAVRLGANSDLAIWVLERSFNEHHSASSYSIKMGNNDVVEVLLDGGAQPGKDMGSKPLYLAISNRNDSLAERLIEAGMDFDQGDKSHLLATSRPGDNVEWENAMFFNCHREDIEQAQRLGEGLPIVHATETACFYQGNGQGGCYRSFLSQFFYDDDVQRL